MGAGLCSGGPCISVTATVDGGRSWAKRTAPRAYSARDDTGGICGRQALCISGLRFANASVGYAFGPDFFVTRDGARTWRREAAPLIVALEISRGSVVRLAAKSTGCPGPCDIRVETALVGSSAWHRRPVLDAAAAGANLAVEGNNVYVAAFGNPAGGAGTAHTRFYRSADGGRSWHTFSDPCGSGPDGENDAVSFAAAPGGFFVALCRPRASEKAPTFVVTSSDAGRSFGVRRKLPFGSGDVVAAGSSRVLAATLIRRSTVAVVVSRDGGRTWRDSLDRSGYQGVIGARFLGFEDDRTARVALGDGSIWTTYDAGRTWTRSDPF